MEDPLLKGEIGSPNYARSSSIIEVVQNVIDGE